MPPANDEVRSARDVGGARTWTRRAVGFAIVLRLVVGVHLYVADPLTRELVSDAAYYNAWARALASGATWEAGEPFWMPPLYPWLLGALYRASAGALAVTLLVQALIGVANTLLFVALVRRLLAPRAVAVAAWIWVLYAPLVLFEQRLLAINAALPLVLGGLYLGVRALEALAAGRAARVLPLCAGLCFGLACLARPNLIVGPLGLALGAWFDLRAAARGGDAPAPVPAVAPARTRLVALALAAVGALVPLAIGRAANVARSGEAVLVSANGGVNFWFGNSPSATGTFRAPSIEWGDIHTQRDVAARIAARDLDRDPASLDADAVNAYWFARGRAWLAEHPSDAALLYGKKLAAHLSSHEYGIQVVPSVVRTSAPSLWLAPLPFGLVLALAVLSRGREVRWRWALIGWMGAATVAALVYFTYSRFRLPWYPALVPFAAAGVVALLPGGGTRRPGVLVGAVAIAVGAFSFVPTEGAYGRGLRANACVDTALAWERRGAARGAPDAVLDERRQWLERALRCAPNDAKALDELARLAWSRGDEARALDLLTRALDTGVDYPPARRRLALLSFQARDPNVRDRERGERVLEQWLSAHPPEAWGALELGLALGEELLRRAPLEPDARTRLDELRAWLARAHAQDPRLVEFERRAQRATSPRSQAK